LRALGDYDFPGSSQKPAFVVGWYGNEFDVVAIMPHKMIAERGIAGNQRPPNCTDWVRD